MPVLTETCTKMTNCLTTAAPAGPVSQQRLLCAVVALTGSIEVVIGSLDLVLVGNIARTPALAPGGLASLAAMALHVLLGLAAIGFAITGRLRFGIAALALWALARWAGDLPSLVRVLDISFSDISLILFKMVAQPVLSAAALIAAWRNRALAAATIALAVMTLIDRIEIAMFALAVSLYGI